MSKLCWLTCLMAFLVAALTPSAGAACPAREVAGDGVLTREEHDADGELYLTQIEEQFERIAYHLRHLTLASSNGHTQAVPTTNEHRTYDPATGLWIKAAEFEVGQHLSELPGGAAVVTETAQENCRQGVKVYNFRLAEGHTYFVREEGATAERITLRVLLWGYGDVPALRASVHGWNGPAVASRLRQPQVAAYSGRGGGGSSAP